MFEVLKVCQDIVIISSRPLYRRSSEAITCISRLIIDKTVQYHSTEVYKMLV